MMNCYFIPYQCYGAANLSAYSFDKSHYGVSVEVGVVLREKKVKSKVVALGADCHSTDSRDAFVGFGDFYDGGTAARGPSLAY